MATPKKANDPLSAWCLVPPPPACVYDQGACVGLPQEWFFREVPIKAEVRAAKAACAVCPVNQECLDYALGLAVNHDYGIWGGLTRNQRNRIRNERKRNSV